MKERREMKVFKKENLPKKEICQTGNLYKRKAMKKASIIDWVPVGKKHHIKEEEDMQPRKSNPNVHIK